MREEKAGWVGTGSGNASVDPSRLTLLLKISPLSTCIGVTFPTLTSDGYSQPRPESTISMTTKLLCAEPLLWTEHGSKGPRSHLTLWPPVKHSGHLPQFADLRLISRLIWMIAF